MCDFFSDWCRCPEGAGEPPLRLRSSVTSVKSGGSCTEQSISESGCGSHQVMPDLTLVCPLALGAVALLPEK